MNEVRCVSIAKQNSRLLFIDTFENYKPLTTSMSSYGNNL